MPIVGDSPFIHRRRRIRTCKQTYDDYNHYLIIEHCNKPVTSLQLVDFNLKPNNFPSSKSNGTEDLALTKFVFHCRRSPPRLLFSRGCHEADCESKHVWLPLSSILSFCLRVPFPRYWLLEVSTKQ